MAKKLNVTVHLTNPDNGAPVVVGPGDKIPSWVDSHLKEHWGDRSDLWSDDGDESAFDSVDIERLKAYWDHGHPHADSAPAGSSEAVDAAHERQVEARDKEAANRRRAGGFTTTDESEADAKESSTSKSQRSSS